MFVLLLLADHCFLVQLLQSIFGQVLEPLVAVEEAPKVLHQLDLLRKFWWIGPQSKATIVGRSLRQLLSYLIVADVMQIFIKYHFGAVVEIDTDAIIGQYAAKAIFVSVIDPFLDVDLWFFSFKVHWVRFKQILELFLFFKLNFAQDFFVLLGSDQGQVLSKTILRSYCIRVLSQIDLLVGNSSNLIVSPFLYLQLVLERCLVILVGSTELLRQILL